MFVPPVWNSENVARADALKVYAKLVPFKDGKETLDRLREEERAHAAVCEELREALATCAQSKARPSLWARIWKKPPPFTLLWRAQA